MNRTDLPPSLPQTAPLESFQRQGGGPPPLVRLWLRCLDRVVASRWQVRHGAALGLRALVLHSVPLLDALSPVPRTKHRIPSKGPGRLYCSLAQSLLVEAYLRGLLVLLLDVFVDYGSGDDAQYPVREVVAQICAASLRALTPEATTLPGVPPLPPPHPSVPAAATNQRGRPEETRVGPALHTRLCSLPLSLFQDGGGPGRAHLGEVRVSILLLVKYILALALPLSLPLPPSNQGYQHALLHDVAELLRSVLEWPVATVQGASGKETGRAMRVESSKFGVRTEQGDPFSSLLLEEQIGLAGECLCLLFRHPSFQALHLTAPSHASLSVPSGSRAGFPSTRPPVPLSLWLEELSGQVWLLLQVLSFLCLQLPTLSSPPPRVPLLIVAVELIVL